MTTTRTGAGDPVRTLRLLWRKQMSEGARRGPRPRLDVDDVVEAAIAIAVTDGLEAVTMRALSARLGVSTMTLYTYVPGKTELLDLMLDTIYGAMPREAWSSQQSWRTRLRAVADANRALYAAHRWAARVSTARPPLGPGQLAKYDHELSALAGLGLSDIEMDAALTFLLGFVQWAATAALDAGDPADELQWWSQAGPLLEQTADPARYPLASRIGSAAGQAQGAAFHAGRAYAFGLDRVLDGLDRLIDQHAGA